MYLSRVVRRCVVVIVAGGLLWKGFKKVAHRYKTAPSRGPVGDPGGVVTLSFLCRLCERDPYQLYQRLEQQAREYVLEMKVRLLRQLSAASKVKAPASLQGPPQAHRFISLLLEEYGALCQAARTVSTFLGTLVRAPSALRRHPGSSSLRLPQAAGLESASAWHAVARPGNSGELEAWGQAW